MAVLNLEAYKGTDLYSDGDVENIIFNIVKNNQDYRKYANSNYYYPIMYHLSPERENILNWYPFNATDTVLEIGAGCGAITGLLCQRAKWVTAIELSKKRAEINYARHHLYDNLEINVGNFNDMDISLQYDYIILNGVFEYAISFTDSPTPYTTFLKKIVKLLSNRGKILIAIENRLGLKYFAGAFEDHTNEYYVGLKNYPLNETVRTFSKSEIEQIFQSCNINEWKFYYPYPDYKFPTEIFTDENINSENYGKQYRNYQEDRLEIFNENEMIKSFKAENIMDVFSNSFLIELSANDIPLSNIIYAKLNNTRKAEYCISTTILKENANYVVEKKALNSKAENHIQAIYRNQSESLPSIFKYLKGNIIDNKIQYNYLNQDNLDSYFEILLKENNLNVIIQNIDVIVNSLMSASTYNINYYNAEFKNYFGDSYYNGKLECLKNCNIDLIFDNLFIQGATYIVTDPEWLCHFWVPTKFIIWRMLNEWYSKHPKINSKLPQKELYQKYGINEEMDHIFRQWAIHFTTNFVSNNDIDDFNIPIKSIDINAKLKECTEINTFTSSLYIDYGNGFLEEQVKRIKSDLVDGHFNLKIILDSSKEIYGMRWDPVEFSFCKCIIEKCLLDGKEIKVIPKNPSKLDSSVFLVVDPQFAISIQPGKYSEIELAGIFDYLDYSYIEETISTMHNAQEKLNDDYIQLQITSDQKTKELQLINKKIQDECTSLIIKSKQESNIYQAVSDVLQTENNNYRIRNDLMQKELIALREQINVLESNHITIKSENDNLSIRLRSAVDEINTIKNSRSWRFLGVWRKLRGLGKNEH